MSAIVAARRDAHGSLREALQESLAPVTSTGVIKTRDMRKAEKRVANALIWFARTHNGLGTQHRDVVAFTESLRVEIEGLEPRWEVWEEADSGERWILWSHDPLSVCQDRYAHVDDVAADRGRFTRGRDLPTLCYIGRMTRNQIVESLD